ncbi:MAG TPA: UDP-3-O-(3-hydroxymyristoyl)glucosamine N-acyltransferase [Elusimicrobiota bacterium]|nr:UDP-3-O-(3-hydroxymyristoyl)glucosamine N-acyltransferase [Elusimicrobiota bacterium]
MNITLAEIAKLTGAELAGSPDAVVTGAAGLAEATDHDISFLENPKYAAQVAASKAAAVILPPAAKGIPGGPANRLYSEHPKRDYAKVLALVEKDRRKPEPAVVSPKADVHNEARLSPGVAVGQFTVIRARAVVGERTQIAPNCTIGYNARVGKDCLIYPNVVIGDHCEIGDRVIIHSGTVLGSDGFGYWTDPKTGQHHKVPQVGKVVLEDDVELGSNVSIDRATTGETRVGAGTKIDNLVQIAHNVRIGRNCIIVSQTGIAGSTRIGNLVTLAGQVGVAGHLVIGDGAIVTAQTGVMSNVEPKAIVFGSPARPHREAMKLQALLSRLPEMYDALKELGGRRKKKEEPHVQG